MVNRRLESASSARRYVRAGQSCARARSTRRPKCATAKTTIATAWSTIARPVRTRPAALRSELACKASRNACAGAFVCTGGANATTEICDGPRGTATASYDNNCNGQIDEGCVFAYDAPVRLDTNGSTQGQHSSFHLAAATAGDNYLIVYADKRTGAGDIYGRVSADAGNTWAAANDIQMTSSANSEVEPSPFLRSGRAYVAYLQFNTNVRRVFVSNTSNAAMTTWGGAKKIDQRTAGDGAFDLYGPHGVVAKAAASGTNDLLAVVWSEWSGSATAPNFNIWLSYSKDGSATWATPLQVNTGTVNKGEVPVLATDGAGMVYVAWRDKRTAGSAQVYFSRIDLTIATPVLSAPLVLQPSGASADDVVVAAEGANVYVAWTDLRNVHKAIRVASSNNRGGAWSQVAGVTDGVVVNSDATFADSVSPAIAAASGRVVVAGRTRAAVNPISASTIRTMRALPGGPVARVPTPVIRWARTRRSLPR